jgi:anaerobic selenocysteine-containing dehydrogenase
MRDLMKRKIETKVVQTNCRECRVGCGMLVRVRQGKAIKVESNSTYPKPYSPEMGSPKMRGFLCKIYKADSQL